MSFVLPLLAFGFWILTCVLADHGSHGSGAYLNPPPEHIERFHFGFKESITDSLWLRWIQDSDSCQTYLSKVIKLDPGKVDNLDLISIPRYKVCDNSWSYKMLEAVTTLSPRFSMPYLFGASMLAILVEDYEGATKIYERGLAQYPDDWELLYRASFHYQFNIKDLPRAAGLLSRAAEKGAPTWVLSLASRLYSKSGQLELAVSTLEAFRKTAEGNEEAIKKVDERLALLKAQIQQ